VRNSPIISVRDLIAEKSGPLCQLAAHARNIRSLGDSIHEFLGTPLNLHCRIANFTEQIVVVHADSPVWLARLRYLAPQLLDFLRTDCGKIHLNDLVLRVRPFLQRAPDVEGSRLRLSTASSELILSLASTISDPKLKRALEHLATHSKKL
jgi:hypothetical protein